jgi:hypothetical protein
MWIVGSQNVCKWPSEQERSMNRTEYLLSKIAEECGELTQRAVKGQCFGLDEIQAGQDRNNEQRLLGEFYDLVGVMDMLFPNAIISKACFVAIEAKRKKVEEFMKLSVSRGLLVDKS